MAYAPHCDSSVLHAPGECQYCDMYPLWQQYREVARIAFTGQDADVDWAPCPSTYFRPAHVRDQWGGNIARSAPGGAQPQYLIREEESISDLR